MSKKKMIIEDTPPEIEISDNELTAAKYTTAGRQRYKQTIDSYSEELFKRATLLGESDKVDGYDREVTEQHVRNATIDMNESTKKNDKPSWTIFTQAGEYLCTGIAGVGASNLSQTWGIFTFGLGLVVGIALFVFRLTKTN